MPVYSDISLTFKAHPGTGDILRKTDLDAVKVAMKNILLSDKFFIPFNPDAGGGLRSALFSNITAQTSTIITRKIKEQLGTYAPRVVVENVLVSDDGENGLNIDILFYVKNVLNQETQRLNMVIERVR